MRYNSSARLDTSEVRDTRGAGFGGRMGGRGGIALGGGGNGRTDPSSYTHGTSAQREKWFSTGDSTGDPKACDTFAAKDLG